MSLRVASLLSLLPVLACGTRVGNRVDCGNHRAKGRPDQLTIPVGATTGPRIDAPRACRDTGVHGVYIAVHGSGTHTIALDHAGGRVGCTTPPADGEPCPVISLDAFAEAVRAGLEARGMTASDFGGPGLGACADYTKDVGPADVSMEILDWKHANTSIEVIHEQLERWGLATFGLSILDDDCIAAERL